MEQAEQGNPQQDATMQVLMNLKKQVEQQVGREITMEEFAQVMQGMQHKESARQGMGDMGNGVTHTKSEPMPTGLLGM